MNRLPRGRHGLPREFVARNQRDRLVAGVTAALYDLGYMRTTVSVIGRYAGVSKSDFYKHFEDKDDCFHVAFDEAVRRLRSRVHDACGREQAPSQWALRVRDGLGALIAFLAANPALASLTLVEGLRAGRGVYSRYQAALEGFAPWLRAGAPPPPAGGRPPVAVDEAVVGGVASLLGRRVVVGKAERLGEMLPGTLEFVLTPYVGAPEARRIVSAG